MAQLSPIVLFTCNRTWHTQQTVKALLKNTEAAESELVIFSDAPGDKSEREGVKEVRAFINSISGFRSVRIVEREQNLGLARSIISGVTEIVSQYGRVIVLEDDIITSPYFLKFMNDGLNYYAQDDRVISLHGYCYPVDGLSGPFFLKGADCWGCATWKRGWDIFESDGRKLLAELTQRTLLDRFNFFGGYDFTCMLKSQIEGRNDSWAVRWYASALLQDKLTLYPGQSLVHNTGNDASGRHCAASKTFDTIPSLSPVQVGGIAVEEDQRALRQFHHFLNQAKPGIISRLIGRIRRTKGVMSQ